MKNKATNILIIVLCLIITLVNLGFNIYNSLFYNLDNLPVGEFRFAAQFGDNLELAFVEIVVVSFLLLTGVQTNGHHNKE